VRAKVAEEVKSGKLHFLLVSPESLSSGGSVFASLIADLPQISFICVDEAHCVSQWSHNFRPAYLRLSKVIRERLGVETLLGLTATAPESTVRDISKHLGVPEKEGGVIKGKLLPKNLLLSVSKDVLRDQGRDSPIFQNYSKIKNPCFVTCVNSALCS
jgi:ATP-dependent DNA helicase Q4